MGTGLFPTALRRQMQPKPNWVAAATQKGGAVGA